MFIPSYLKSYDLDYTFQVSVIQPVSGCGLAILSIFSHFYLKEIMNTIDWVGITLAGIGTIGNVSPWS